MTPSSGTPLLPSPKRELWLVGAAVANAGIVGIGVWALNRGMSPLRLEMAVLLLSVALTVSTAWLAICDTHMPIYFPLLLHFLAWGGTRTLRERESLASAAAIVVSLVAFAVVVFELRRHHRLHRASGPAAP